MATIEALPEEFATTRADLQRVATHVLARARAAHGGRFGLRVTPTGLATPPFGDNDSVLRLAGTTLVIEQQHTDGVAARTLSLVGVSLAEAAAFAGTSLAEPFGPGADAPAVGDVDAPLLFDAGSLGIILGWYVTGACVLDAVLPHLDAPTGVQLWPEHFDLGMTATAGSAGVNLGASPGDGGVAEPYLYVAPWTADRPGDPDFWNVPYGAVATRSTLLADGDPIAAGVAFVTRGLGLLDTA
jgi:hypothetical protein